MTASLIRPRDRDAIVQALSAGVVPKAGLRHIQVGRSAEINALVRDIDRLADGGSTVRFIIGEYGSGKTFFLNLVRLIALERKHVAIQADLAPERRLYAGGGQARALYAEAVRNLSTRVKPEGGALANIVERFVTDAGQRAAGEKKSVEQVIEDTLAPLRDNVGGYDYAVVLKAYWRGSEDQNED